MQHGLKDIKILGHGQGLSNDEVQSQLDLVIKDQPSAEVALLHLMDKYDFNLDELKASLMEQGLNVSFSNVTYPEVAYFIGLAPLMDFIDAPKYHLCRSRIPTALFRAIVTDMDVLLIQYGRLEDHATEEASSRFLAPIINHLVAQFGGAIQNTPESLISGRIATRGRIEYYLKTFKNLSIVFVEMKLKIRSAKERSNAIAQVIAECDACDWNNAKLGVSTPVYGVLYDGSTFQFFTFDGSTGKIPYRFSTGVAQGRGLQVTRGLPLADFSSGRTARSFIHNLRPICETLFNILLVAYIANIKVFHDGSTSPHGHQESPDGWNKALWFAEEALAKSKDATEAVCRDELISADATTEEAFKALKRSTDAVPIANEYVIPPLMDDWSDDEVARV